MAAPVRPAVEELEHAAEQHPRHPWLQLLRPQAKTMSLALLAVVGETIADLLQPWTLKIVLDNVVKAKPVQGHGWLDHVVLTIAGTEPMAVLRFAAIAGLVVAI